MNLVKKIDQDELNLIDLFQIFWAYKFLIAFVTIIASSYGVYYAVNSDKKYTSTVIFKVSNDDSSLGNTSDLLSIAGIKPLSNTDNIPIEKLTGRIFIKKLDKKLNFKNDLYFNTFNPNHKNPYWKTYLKELIGWDSIKPSTDEIIWQNIVKKFKESLVSKETDSGSTVISFTHTDAFRAADIANEIMYLALSDRKASKHEFQQKQTAFFSQTLADALSDLELAQTKLKVFTLENSALPLELFTAGSLELDALREQYNKTNELYSASEALEKILSKEIISQKDYLDLQREYPIIDQVDFRRILGLNDDLNSWKWPKKKLVSAVLNTLSERMKILRSKMIVSQNAAEKSGEAFETFLNLEREAKVAEATYEVLTEQFKAKAILAGFQLDENIIYELATPTIRPSEPNYITILAVSVLSGIFFGYALALIISRSRRVCYSKEAIISYTQPIFSENIKQIYSLRKKNLSTVCEILIKKPRSALRNLTIEIYKYDVKQIVISSSKAKIASYEFAKILACYIQTKDINVAIIDYSTHQKNAVINDEEKVLFSYAPSDKYENITILVPVDGKNSLDVLGQRDFTNNLESLGTIFDFVLICADNEDALTLLRAVQEKKNYHVMLTRKKYTRANSISKMISLLPVQGLLHD